MGWLTVSKIDPNNITYFPEKLGRSLLCITNNMFGSVGDEKMIGRVVVFLYCLVGASGKLFFVYSLKCGS